MRGEKDVGFTVHRVCSHFCKKKGNTYSCFCLAKIIITESLIIDYESRRMLKKIIERSNNRTFESWNVSLLKYLVRAWKATMIIIIEQKKGRAPECDNNTMINRELD